MISRTIKAYLSLLGVCLIYFAMGPYLAIGNTGVYLSSYLVYRTESEIKLEDSIWLIAAGGFSAIFLPFAGWLEGVIGVRSVCLIGGLTQSFGILATYYALDMNFLTVAITYGGAYLFSLGFSYSSPVVNVCKWFPKHRGLVTGIGTAAMAIGPIVFIPIMTELINPDNLAANSRGLFEDNDILDRTKSSTLIQGFICLALFLVGIALTFPAKSIVDSDDCNDDDYATRTKQNGVDEYQMSNVDNYINNKSNNSNNNQTIKRKEMFDINQATMTFKLNENGQQEISIDASHCSLEPKFAFQTSEFWILSLKMFITELIYVYLLFMYKPYGQTFIHDDHFLSAIGAGTAISNTLGRLTMGHFKDKFGYLAISIPLSMTTLLFICLMPFTEQLNKLFYGVSVLLAVGSVGSQYALMPSAAQDCFGDKYASINIGFVYLSMALSTIVSTLLSHYFTPIIGWTGMIYIMAGFALIDFLATLCFPSEPADRLVQRYIQFYLIDLNRPPLRSQATTSK